MKKLINDPSRVVSDMLEAVVALRPELRLLRRHAVVWREGAPGEVALISGGGSGHEPAHAGFVGRGLLRAAVCGDVFTSPSADAVLAAIRAVGGPAGVLLIVKNYTGDRLNFGLAAELARAEGIRTEIVVVDDDMALDAGPRHAGRRGIAGTVLVHKVAGAAAASGLDLDAVAAEAREAVAALGTVGVALSGCSIPGAREAGFVLGAEEIELGLGIHGERGVSRLPMADAASLVDTLLERIVRGLGLRSGERVALLVNGLGATPPMELLVVAREALRGLAERRIDVERCWSGSFLTALDMQGCSLSLLRVDGTRLERLDADARAPGWPGPAARPGPVNDPCGDEPEAEAAAAARGRDAPLFRSALLAAIRAIREAEPELTRMDRAVGDGDLGLSLARGAAAIESELPSYDLASPRRTLEGIAGTLRRTIGGTSGPLYAVLLLRAASHLRGDGPDLQAWASGFEAGWRAIGELGDSAPGDRTMLDALSPAASAFAAAVEHGLSGHEAVRAAADAADQGARSTASMVPRRGRSSYLADRVGGEPDPGAVAVSIWLRAIAQALAGIPASEP